MPNLYENVVLKDARGYVWVGNVVSHLSLSDWADWHHYRIDGVNGFRPALPAERTHLSPPLRKGSGVFLTPSLLMRAIVRHK